MIDWLRLREPPDVAPAAYRASVRGVVAFAVSVGIQLTVLAMIALGPLAAAIPAEELTEIGRRNMRPELDLPVFYAGCTATVLLVVVCAHVWRRRVGRGAGVRSGLAVHLILAVGSLLGFAALCDVVGGSIGDDGRMPVGDLARLALPAATAALLWLGFLLGAARRAPAPADPDART